MDNIVSGLVRMIERLNENNLINENYDFVKIYYLINSYIKA